MKNEFVHLICLPFAGGNSYSYRDIEAHIASFIKVLPIELPGRGRRFGEPLLTCLHDIADDALNQAIDVVSAGPYALFGHSMGSKVAYEMARRIARQGLPAPAHLFVSGSAAPSSPPADRTRHLLPRKAFFALVQELEGAASEVLNDPDMADLFEPVLRADFQANDAYEYLKQEPLTVPITVMIGAEDTVSYEDALEWGRETTGRTRVLRFPGGHFFIRQHSQAIGELLSQTLQRLAEAPDPWRP